MLPPPLIESASPLPMMLSLPPLAGLKPIVSAPPSPISVLATVSPSIVSACAEPIACSIKVRVSVPAPVALSALRSMSTAAAAPV